MLRTWPRRIVFAVLVVLGLGFIVTAEPMITQAQRTLSTLADLNEKDVQRFLDAHPEVSRQLLSAAPVPLARWWKGVSQEDRDTLIERIPEQMGNLDGIDYVTRDRANRIHLAGAIASFEQKVAKDPTDATAAAQLTSLKAIASAIREKGRWPGRQLATFSNDQPPLAAVVVGNLDTARIVTYDVPGMGTYTDDMSLWTQSAQNVWDMQGEVGANKRRAAVAWIGYKTPPPGIAASRGSYAREGAQLLAGDIEGLQAARTGTLAPVINVIGHSYGTTTAANTLHDNRFGVFSFVMLGSAGVEKDIRTVADLDTAAFAGEAAADALAKWGRLSRIDPRSPGFGATIIEVDGDAKLGLLAVTGHAPVLHSPWNDNPESGAWSHITDRKVFEQEFLEHSQAYGYLDYGTESLYNAAIATTPTPNRPFSANGGP